MLEECVQRRIISSWVSYGSGSCRSQVSGTGNDRQARARKDQGLRSKAQEKLEGVTWDAEVDPELG